MKFRYARHTQNLTEIRKFYTEILEFEVLGSFNEHDGYDGIFLGKPNKDWHLEFTCSKEYPDSKFDEDDLLVFYPETMGEFQKISENMKSKNIPIGIPKNPYWKKNGILIFDPDGFGIILSKLFTKA